MQNDNNNNNSNSCVANSTSHMAWLRFISKLRLKASGGGRPEKWTYLSRRLFCMIHSLSSRKTSKYEAIEHNERQPIYRLPREMLLGIMRFLDDIDLVALRQTCQGFFRIIPDGPWILQAGNKELWRHLLLHEKYLQRLSVGLTHNFKSSPVCARCSSCHECHQLSAFTRKQLRRDPDSRICIGMEGRLRICAHMSLTRAQLTRALYEARERDNGFLPNMISCEIIQQCDHDHGSLSHTPQSGFIRGRLTARRDLAYCFIDTEYHVLSAQPGSPANQSAIRERIRQLNTKLCPHLTTTTPAVYHLQLHEGCAGIPHNSPWACPGCQKSTRKCPHPQCNTKFSLYRKFECDGQEGDVFKLRIRRQIGYPCHPRYYLDPNAPSWLAQLEIDSHDLDT